MEKITHEELRWIVNAVGTAAKQMEEAEQNAELSGLERSLAHLRKEQLDAAWHKLNRAFAQDHKRIAIT